MKFKKGASGHTDQAHVCKIQKNIKPGPRPPLEFKVLMYRRLGMHIASRNVICALFTAKHLSQHHLPSEQWLSSQAGL